MDLRELNEEVLAATEELSLVTWADAEALKRRAIRVRRRRARVLLHGATEAALHEMVIVMSRGQYMPPHRNDRSAKSWLVLEGSFVLVRFDDYGAIRDHHGLAAGRGGGAFMARIECPVWHTCIPMTELVVFIETGLGPHVATRFADWAPAVDDVAAPAYFAALSRAVGLPEAPLPEPGSVDGLKG